jgi:hypothetical protein
MHRNMMMLGRGSFREGLMNAMQVVGIALAAFSVGPFIFLIGLCRNVRREFRVAGIREPEITLRTLSGPGGVTGFLLFTQGKLRTIGRAGLFRRHAAATRNPDTRNMYLRLATTEEASRNGQSA